MTEDKNINKTTPQSEEQEIDLIELAQKVWAGRKPKETGVPRTDLTM